MKNLVLYIVLLLAICSCNEDSLHKDASKMYGRTILMPFHNLNNNKPIVINYIDSLGCVKCKLRLKKWVDLKNNINKFGVVFIAHSHSYPNVKLLMDIDSVYDIPLYEDVNNEWMKLNEIPDNEILHTFLVDSTFNVIAIGNPAQNEQIKELYLKILNSRK